MTTLAIGSGATVNVADGGTVKVASNGGFWIATFTQVAGASGTETFGPGPARKTFGPFSEGGSVTISNTSANQLDYDSGPQGIDPALQAAVSGAGIGGSANYTRVDLIAASIAGTLTPGAWYRTTEGVRAYASSSSLLSSPNWLNSGVRSAIGGNLTLANLAYVNLPVMGANSKLTVRTAGSFTNSAAGGRKLYMLLGGLLTDAVGTSGVDTLLDRTLATTTYDWDIRTVVSALGSAAVQRTRVVGNSAEGVGGSLSRMLANTQYAAGNALLRVAGITVLSGSSVAISPLVIQADGYAYGTVVAGTFTDLALLRYGKITGATGATACNVNPATIDLLTAGWPSPVLAPIGTATSGLTLFRYPVAATSGTATGSPVLELYHDMALESFHVAIEQGATA